MRSRLSAFAFGFTLVLLLPLFAHADLNSQIQKAHDLRLSERTEWLRLLHSTHKFIAGWESLSKGKGFFLSPNGPADASAELDATLRAFYSAEKRDLPTQEPISLSAMCQFPARFQFLNRALHLEAEQLPVRLKDCTDYQNFRERLDLESVSLVFSSHYVDNPSSIYGHTLLRLQKKSTGADKIASGERSQLLDNGVNFSADPTTSNPFLYALYGLTGGFDGHFAVLPFYYKVREYSDYESRDLWDYKLELGSDELDRLQAHLWELGTTHFDYYYITENCSYYILSLLEAAAPRLELLSRLPFWILPSDTVKAVANAGLVKEVTFRPSLHSQFEARKEKLNSDQMKALRLLDRDPNREAARINDGDVLDAALDLFDLRHLEDLLNKNPQTTKQKQSLLIARSKLPPSQPLGSLQGSKVSPHLSHPSTRIGVGAVRDQKNANALEAQVRFAYHDLLDPEAGLPTTSDIQFFDFKVRYWEARRMVRIENATLFGVTQLNPIRDFFNSPSWKFKAQVRRFDDPRCENCTGFSLEGGYGLTLDLSKSNLIYTMIEGDLETSPRFRGSKFQPRLGPLLGTRLRINDTLATYLEIKALRNFLSESFTENSLVSRVRWVPLRSSLGLEVAGLWTSERQEIQGSVLLYF